MCFPKIDISSVYLLFRLSQPVSLDFPTKPPSVCGAAWHDVRQWKRTVLSHILNAQSDIIRNYPQPSPHLSHFIPLETAETITSHFHFITHHTLCSAQHRIKKQKISPGSSGFSLIKIFKSIAWLGRDMRFSLCVNSRKLKSRFL